MHNRPIVSWIALSLQGFAILFGAAIASLHAQQPPSKLVRVNRLFSDNMVLQRGTPVLVWGAADGDVGISVSFRGQTVRTTATHGKWQASIEPLEAGGPFKLTIVGPVNKIELSNMLVGEVWVAGGESNMEMSVAECFNASANIADSANSNIRLLTFDHRGSPTPDSEIVAGSWTECGPKTVGHFSAVAYFFGSNLQKRLHVPIGLISASVSGTTAERWLSKEALDAAPDLKSMERPQGESDLYNAMIHPLLQFGIRGAIWYQGESNAGEAYDYRTLFPALIKDWRTGWKRGDFPFLFVQLAPFRDKNFRASPQWAELRDAQLHTMRTVPNTAMAVITDIADEQNMHPVRKEPVGERLALAARALAYGEKIEYSGPIFDRLTFDGNNPVVHFSRVGKGLELRGNQLLGFTILRDGGTAYIAEAKIVGDTVVVTVPFATRPMAVRFGWDNFPEGNLWNKDGLPASPFRSDDFQLTTEREPTKEKEPATKSTLKSTP